MKRISVILKKELLDTFRDRRTLLIMIVVPIILMPIAIIGFGKFVEGQQKSVSQEKKRVAITYENADLKKAFKSDKTIALKISKKPLDDLRKKKAEAALIIDKNFKNKLQNNRAINVKVWTDQTNPSSVSAGQNIVFVLSNFSQSVRIKRLAKLKIDPQVLNPLNINTGNIASKNKMGGQFLSFLMPMMIVTWAIIGGLYTAIDLSAGEKERKSLEALLMTPASRVEIVLGKFLAVLFVSVTTIIFAVTSLYWSLKKFPIEVMEMSSGSLNFSLSIEASIALLALAVLIAAMFSAVMLALCIFARSFKEGQNYLTALYTIALVPIAVISITPKLDVNWLMLMAPVINVIVVFKELFLNDFNVFHYSVTFLSTLLYALLAIFATTRIFSSEKVMFRQ